MTHYLDLLEKKLVSHIEDAQKRKKAAKKSKIEHYFSGQYDALTQALLELRVLKYELAMPDADDADDALTPEPVTVVATDVIDADDSADDGRPARKKPRKRKKSQPKEEPSPAMLAAQDLLQQAIAAGVIEQKISLYVHEDFPNGRLRGRTPVLELLVDEALAGKVAQQIAEATPPPAPSAEEAV